MPRALPQALLALALLLAAPDAGAVIVGPGDGTQNTTAPDDDPGWANVGRRNGLGVIYLGNGWVLTAAHVGIGPVTFDGVSYDAIPESLTTFETGPGQVADLIAFKLSGDPGLPALAIPTAAPPVGATVVMVGWGRNRGAETSWSGIDGWLWGSGTAKRWGTNRIRTRGVDVTVGSRITRSLDTDFTGSPPSQVTTSEAQAATGDSGGALFWWNGSSWTLAGVLYAVGTFSGQPASMALLGNVTYSVDLAYYRAEILAVTQQPACSNGLDDDGDGLVDHPADPGCEAAGDLDERSPSLPCDDGADQDGDGLVDFPDDPVCRDPSHYGEHSQCQDGLDNDGQPGIDFDGGAAWNGGVALGEPDPDCKAPWRDGEATGYTCGLGAELVLLAPLAGALARRRRRRAAC